MFLVKVMLNLTENFLKMLKFRIFALSLIDKTFIDIESLEYGGIKSHRHQPRQNKLQKVVQNPIKDRDSAYAKSVAKKIKV